MRRKVDRFLGTTASWVGLLEQWVLVCGHIWTRPMTVPDKPDPKRVKCGVCVRLAREEMMPDTDWLDENGDRKMARLLKAKVAKDKERGPRKGY